MHYKYDIKGSTVDREATMKEKEKSHPTFKDNDFVNESRQINIGSEAKVAFMEKLTRDVEFLTALKIMDYSLLIGIHDEKLSLAKAYLSDEVSDDQAGSPATERKAHFNGSDTEGRTDSDQEDNLSPGEGEEEADEGQLNLSSPTPPGSPFTADSTKVGIFGIPSVAG